MKTKKQISANKSTCFQAGGFIIKCAANNILAIYAIMIASIILSTSYTAHSTVISIDAVALNELQLGDLVPGTTKSQFDEEQVIKFEIVCKIDKKIKITNNLNVNSQFFIVNAEWKAGDNTGFETDLVNGGIYNPQGQKFYVTLKIKSIQTLSTAVTGSYVLIPNLTIEYVD